jgi:integrase/recombinase XerC
MSDVSVKDEWTPQVDRYARYLERQDKKPLTVRNYRRELHAFARYHRQEFREPPDLVELTADDLREYRNHLQRRKLKPATIALARAALAGVVKWALAERIIGEPIPPPKTPRVGRRTAPRSLSKDEERRLRKVVRKAGNASHRGLLELFLVSGVRISEAAGLTWCDLTMTRTVFRLRVMGKGDKERILEFQAQDKVNERAREAFHLLGFKEHGREKARPILWGQRGPLTASGIKQLLTPYGRAAGLEGFSAHVLRHTCAKRMLERKPPAPLPTVAVWMGHESLNTTMLYTLPSAEDLARAAGASDEGGDDDSGDDD